MDRPRRGLPGSGGRGSAPPRHGEAALSGFRLNINRAGRRGTAAGPCFADLCLLSRGRAGTPGALLPKRDGANEITGRLAAPGAGKRRGGGQSPARPGQCASLARSPGQERRSFPASREAPPAPPVPRRQRAESGSRRRPGRARPAPRNPAGASKALPGSPAKAGSL